MKKEIKNLYLDKAINLSDKTVFTMRDTISGINEYFEDNFTVEDTKKKIFYHYHEWQGWRFYKKALLNLDFKSIWGRLKIKFKALDNKN